MDEDFIENKKNQRSLAEDDYQRRAKEYNDRVAANKENDARL
jgi:hypothetical protein